MVLLIFAKSIQKYPWRLIYIIVLIKRLALIYAWNDFDCHRRLQVWILYYQVLKKAEKCLPTSSHTKSLHATDIKEVQSIYCSGLDLETPLVLSLSPCSNKHKQEIGRCITDFAKTFSSDFSNSSLCR